MKKLLIFLLLIINLNTFAFTGGVKGGLNYTIPQAKSGYEEHFSNDYGYTLGGFLSFNLTEKLFLNTELMLNSWQYEFNAIEESIKSGNANYQALDFSLLFAYNAIDCIYINLGVFGGFPISYTGKYIYNSNKSSSWESDLDRKLLSYGMLIGLTYKYNKFLVDFRYLYNLSPFLDKEHYEWEMESSCNELGNDSLYCKQNKFHQFQLLVDYEF